MHKTRKNIKKHKELIEESTNNSTLKPLDINEICERTTTNFAKSTLDNLNYQRDNSNDSYNETKHAGVSQLKPYIAFFNNFTPTSKESSVLNSKKSTNKESIISNGLKSAGKDKKYFLEKINMNEHKNFNFKNITTLSKNGGPMINVNKTIQNNENNELDEFKTKFFNKRKQAFKIYHPKEMIINNSNSNIFAQFNTSNQNILNVSGNQNNNNDNALKQNNNRNQLNSKTNTQNNKNKPSKQYCKFCTSRSQLCCGIQIYYIIFFSIIILSIIGLSIFFPIYFSFR